MVMALSKFTNSCPQKLANCYQSRQIAYIDFLEANFDESQNKNSPLAQIYNATKTKNEVFTLKEMLTQLDRDQFIKVMHDEVEAIFKENIWKRVLKKLMKNYYQG